MSSTPAPAEAIVPNYHVPTSDDLKAFRAKIVNLARELLVTKSTATTAGIMLHYTLTFTMIAVFFLGRAKATVAPTDPPEVGTISTTMLVTMTIFLGLLLGTVYLTRFIQSTNKIPQEAKNTYCAGIRLIPAWAWKDVILNSYSVMVIYKAVDKDTPAQVCLFAVLVSLLSAIIFLVLQKATSHLGEATVARCAVQGLMTSFALGCGWAMNTAVRSFIDPASFKDMQFCLVYAAVGTVAAPLLQWGLSKLTAFVQYEVSEGATTGVAVCKALELVGLSLNFVMAWGWKSLLDLHTTDMRGTALDEFLAILYINFICILGPAIIGVLGAPKIVNSSLALAAGMNIGWQWCDLIMHEMKKKDALNVPIVWGFCILVLAIVLVFAEVADRIIRCFEHFEDYVEDMAHLKVPGAGDPEYGAVDAAASKPVPSGKAKAKAKG